MHYSLRTHRAHSVISRLSLVCAFMTAGFQKASLSVYQRGQMSGFAVEEQAQPHLINNIIVLLHTTIKTSPHHHHSSLFLLFLFQALAACCPVARLSQSDTATIHKNKTWVKSQRDKTNSATVSCWSKARQYRREKSACIFKDFASFVLLFFCNYEVRATRAPNKSSACRQQVKHRRGKFTYISASKQISEYKSRVSWESLRVICACTVNLRISLAAYCSSVNFDRWFFFFFVFLLQRR